MYGSNDHEDREVNEALKRLCSALTQWERMTGRQSVLILRENNGEMPGESMSAEGYTIRAVNGVPLDPSNGDLPDSHILEPFTLVDADGCGGN